MANVCAITGKKPMSGNNNSHSRRKTKRRYLPNLHKKSFMVDGKKITLKVSAHGLRIIDKYGIEKLGELLATIKQQRGA